jgi:hypothetical protein
VAFTFRDIVEFKGFVVVLAVLNFNDVVFSDFNVVTPKAVASFTVDVLSGFVIVLLIFTVLIVAIRGAV